MQRLATVLLGLSTFLPLWGCGGLTQEDMMRHAIRRPSDDEDQPAAAVAATANRSTAATGETPQPDAAPVARDVPAARDVAAPPATTDPAEDAGRALAQPALPQFPRVSQPAEPLELVERRQRTIDNMVRIGDALRSHTEQKSGLPPAAILSSSGRPLLSWRVELLPYLGYEELYQQFRLDEPWDSPHNQLLLPFIPKEYQSPERFDERTNYLVPVASFTAFQGTRGLGIRKIEDGLENTIVVLEVDDELAVHWTKPQDLPFNLHRFNTNVGNLREDGFFVIWGTGEVTRVRPDATDAELRAAFTVDAGEPISSFAIRAEATAEPAVEEAAEDEIAKIKASAGPTGTAGKEGDRAESATGPETARWPVPDEATLNEAKELLREIYEDQYVAAKTLREKRELARRLLNDANRMQEDYSGRYALLEVAVKIAAEAGDAKTALEAADQMTASYEVDALALTKPAIEMLIKTDEAGSGASDIFEAATRLIDLAIDVDDYESAEALCGIAIAAARKNDARREAVRLEQRKHQIRAAKKSFAAVRRIVASIDSADDPQANLEVGRFYCLVKSDWEKGLPLLARCSDAGLADLALQEMKTPTIPADQLKLADGWWMLAEEKQAHEKALQLRAVYWYLQALNGLSNGLHRVKAEMRVKEAEDKYGSQEVAELLAAG